MRKLIFILLTIVFNYTSYSQNLVPNGSFEQYSTCPSGADISNCLFWSSPTQQGTTDFFNVCAGSNGYGVPANVWGNELAQEGDGYSMVVTYGMGTSYREYLQTQLNQTLVAGEKYLVTFYASLADSVHYSSNNIGFSFSSVFLNSNVAVLPLIPYYNNSIVITNTIWNKLSFEITANGDENYLIIGNFYEDSLTQTQVVGATSSFETAYYIDSVSVTFSPLNNLYNSSISNSLIIPAILDQNDPLNNKIEISNDLFETKEFLIYDIIGNLISSSSSNLLWNGKSLNGSNCNQGIYIYRGEFVNRKTNNHFFKVGRIILKNN